MPIIGKSGYADLARVGASVKVRVTPPGPVLETLHKEGKKPQYVSAHGLFDTGAGCSCIDQGIAEQLNLKHRDEREVLTPSGSTVQLLYDVRLFIGDTGFLDLAVFGSDLARQAHHVLLGRDVLKYGTLIYSGRSCGFEFCV